MRKASMAEMMGIKTGAHSGMKKPMQKMEKKEYSKKGLSPSAMKKHESAEYGSGKSKKC
jgi:hypothetical protein